MDSMSTPETSRSRDTRIRLLSAAREVVCDQGVAGASARKIAAAAGVNQALVFYHFAGVHELIAASSTHFVDEALEHYREPLAAARTTSDLLKIAEDLRSREGRNAAFMAQILAAAQIPVIGEAAAHALGAWTEQIDGALQRITTGTVLAEVMDTRGLAPLITAAFVGLELYDGANPSGGAAAGESLTSLTAMIDSLLSAGPVASRAVARAARHALKP